VNGIEFPFKIDAVTNFHRTMLAYQFIHSKIHKSNKLFLLLKSARFT